jgi:hypothetical protein
MREAATNLEFEKAVRLRDELKRLREMELDTLEGAADDWQSPPPLPLGERSEGVSPPGEGAFHRSRSHHLPSPRGGEDGREAAG